MRHALDSPMARRDFMTALGGVVAVSLMSHEARADALDEALTTRMDTSQIDVTTSTSGPAPGAKHFPTVAEIDAQIPTRSYRRGLGGLFVGRSGKDSARQTRRPRHLRRPLCPAEAVRFSGGQRIGSPGSRQSPA